MQKKILSLFLFLILLINPIAVLAQEEIIFSDNPTNEEKVAIKLQPVARNILAIYCAELEFGTKFKGLVANDKVEYCENVYASGVNVTADGIIATSSSVTNYDTDTQIRLAMNSDTFVEAYVEVFAKDTKDTTKKELTTVDKKNITQLIETNETKFEEAVENIAKFIESGAMKIVAKETEYFVRKGNMEFEIDEDNLLTNESEHYKAEIVTEEKVGEETSNDLPKKSIALLKIDAKNQIKPLFETENNPKVADTVTIIGFMDNEAEALTEKSNLQVVTIKSEVLSIEESTIKISGELPSSMTGAFVLNQSGMIIGVVHSNEVVENSSESALNIIPMSALSERLPEIATAKVSEVDQLWTQGLDLFWSKDYENSAEKLVKLTELNTDVELANSFIIKANQNIVNSSSEGIEQYLDKYFPQEDRQFMITVVAIGLGVVVILFILLMVLRIRRKRKQKKMAVNNVNRILNPNGDNLQSGMMGAAAAVSMTNSPANKEIPSQENIELSKPVQPTAQNIDYNNFEQKVPFGLEDKTSTPAASNTASTPIVPSNPMGSSINSIPQSGTIAAQKQEVFVSELAKNPPVSTFPREEEKSMDQNMDRFQPPIVESPKAEVKPVVAEEPKPQMYSDMVANASQNSTAPVVSEPIVNEIEEESFVQEKPVNENVLESPVIKDVEVKGEGEARGFQGDDDFSFDQDATVLNNSQERDNLQQDRVLRAPENLPVVESLSQNPVVEELQPDVMEEPIQKEESSNVLPQEQASEEIVTNQVESATQEDLNTPDPIPQATPTALDNNPTTPVSDANQVNPYGDLPEWLRPVD